MSSGMTDRVRPGRGVSSVLQVALSVLVERTENRNDSLVMRRSGVRLPKAAHFRWSAPWSMISSKSWLGAWYELAHLCRSARLVRGTGGVRRSLAHPVTAARQRPAAPGRARTRATREFRGLGDELLPTPANAGGRIRVHGVRPSRAVRSVRESACAGSVEPSRAEGGGGCDGGPTGVRIEGIPRSR